MLCLTFALVQSNIASPKRQEFFVSAGGKDSNSGRSWSSSFATLQKAIEAAGGKGDIHVRGAIRTSSPVVLNGASGLTIEGEKGAQLVGSVRVDDWQASDFSGVEVFKAKWPLADPPFELFVSSQRAERSRLPTKGFFHFSHVDGGAAPWNEGQDRAAFNPVDIPTLTHPEDAEVVVHQLWVTSRLPIANFDPANHLFTFGKKSVFKLSDAQSGQPSNYYLENVAEALKSPGQWYWSSTNSTVYYVPRPGERLGRFSAEVPVVSSVLSVTKSSNIEVRNLEISGSEYRYPSTSSGDGQAAISVPAAVELIDSQNCVFRNDTVIDSGTYGFEVSGSSQGNRFDRCRVENVGAGGVKIGPGTSATSVEDCTFRHLGKTYPSAIGVWIGNSGHNRVSHCLIEDAGYTGISVGWTWGYGKSDATDNLIESNLIRDLGHGELSDMGGIYTLGVSPGTILRHNRIDQVRCTYYGGWGIYLDEGSSNILVEDNLVTNCQTGSFHQHYGANNLIRNNIFAFAPSVGQLIRTRPEDHVSFTMEHNIIDWQGTPLFGGNLSGAGIVFRDNLLWGGGSKIDLPAFAGSDNKEADPLFANVREQRFSLSRNSPANSIGFKPFDLNSFGPQLGKRKID